MVRCAQWCVPFLVGAPAEVQDVLLFEGSMADSGIFACIRGGPALSVRVYSDETH